MNERVLVLSPHPDDESIGCGGTLRKHVTEKDTVRVLFLTSGEAGGHGLPRESVAEIREAEACAAMKILGFESLEFWRQPDGKLHVDESLTKRLRSCLEVFNPDIIYVPHSAEMHPDHRAANQLLEEAFAGYEVRSPVVVRMYEVWTPLQQLDDIVDITDYIETKLEAVRTYKSQCDVLNFDDAIRGLNRYRGEMHCWPEGDYAEVFQRMRL